MRIVEGDFTGLPDVAAGLVAQIVGAAKFCHILVDARAVRATAVQIDVEDHFKRRVPVAAVHTTLIGFDALARAQFQRGVIGRFACLTVRAVAAQGGNGGEKIGVGAHRFGGVTGGRFHILGHRIHRGQRSGRQHTNQALVTHCDIVQVADFGQPIGLGQGLATGGLFQINLAAHAGGHFLAQAIMDFQVVGEVVGGELDQFAIAQYVEVGPRDFLCGLVADGQQIKIRSLLGIAQAPHFMQCGKSVEKSLSQLQRGPVVGVIDG